MHLLLALLLAVQPFANLNSTSTPSGLFYATLALCLGILGTRRFQGATSLSLQYWPLIVCFSLLLLAVGASSVYHSDWPGANGEGAIRLFLGFWVSLLAVQYLSTRYLQWSVQGFALAGVVSAAMLLSLTLPDFERPDALAHNAVTYGNYMVYISAVSVFAMGWQLTRYPTHEFALKVAVAAITLFGFMLTQTRTGWLAVPLFVLIGIVLFFGMQQWRKALIAFVVALVGLVAVFSSSDALRERAVEGYQDVLSCTGEGALQVTSVCVRIQLYRSSIDMFQQRPWMGLGDGGHFNETMVKESYPKGLIGDYLAKHSFFGEPHNDLLFMLVSFGIPGFLGLLAAYLAPCWYFVRRLGASVPQPARVAAAMGLALCLGFLIFGLTETMFRRMHTLSFYAVFVAVFISLSDPRRYTSASAK